MEEAITAIVVFGHKFYVIYIFKLGFNADEDFNKNDSEIIEGKQPPPMVIP